jgi:hypothetical protein
VLVEPHGMRQSAHFGRTLFGTITASIATILTGQAAVTLDAMRTAPVASSCDLVVFITWSNRGGGGGRGAVDVTCFVVVVDVASGESRQKRGT